MRLRCWRVLPSLTVLAFAVSAASATDKLQIVSVEPNTVPVDGSEEMYHVKVSAKGMTPATRTDVDGVVATVMDVDLSAGTMTVVVPESRRMNHAAVLRLSEGPAESFSAVYIIPMGPKVLEVKPNEIVISPTISKVSSSAASMPPSSFGVGVRYFGSKPSLAAYRAEGEDWKMPERFSVTGDRAFFTLPSALQDKSQTVELKLANASGESAGTLRIIRKVEMKPKDDMHLPSAADASPLPPGSIHSETAEGLATTTFDTPAGSIHVYLPDDMAAGDTISGTVIFEHKAHRPTDQTPQQVAQSDSELTGYVVEIEQQRPSPDGKTMLHIPENTGQVLLVLKNKAGQEVARQPVPVQPGGRIGCDAAGTVVLEGGPGPSDAAAMPGDKPAPGGEKPAPGVTKSGVVPGAVNAVVVQGGRNPNPNNALPSSDKPAPGATNSIIVIDGRNASTPNSFMAPRMAQAGRPLQICGAFDGNLKTTALKVGGKAALALAESPRKAVFQSPPDVTGQQPLELTKNNLLVQGQLQSIAVKLFAPQLQLLRGQTTTLTVTVTGLEGWQGTVPLSLVNRSPNVVSLQGGNMQLISIDPTQTRGAFVINRTLTGIQPGGFDIGARVQATAPGANRPATTPAPDSTPVNKPDPGATGPAGTTPTKPDSEGGGKKIEGGGKKIDGGGKKIEGGGKRTDDSLDSAWCYPMSTITKPAKLRALLCRGTFTFELLWTPIYEKGGSQGLFGYFAANTSEAGDSGNKLGPGTCSHPATTLTADEPGEFHLSMVEPKEIQVGSLIEHCASDPACVFKVCASHVTPMPWEVDVARIQILFPKF